MIAAALLAATVASAAPSARIHEVPGVFRANAGPRWSGRGDWAGRYPLYLLTRASNGGASAFISVESFSDGNALYPTPERYLAEADEAPRRERPVSRGSRVVAGAKRTIWERAYAAPARMRVDGDAPSKRWVERFVLVERPGGFLVLRLKAVEPEFPERSGEFDAFLASFEALSER